VSPNTNQFASNNNNKSFNSFKNNRNFNNKNVNKNIIKNVNRQVISGPSYQRQKSQPIQMNRNFANQQQPQPPQAYFNNINQNHQSGSFNNSPFGFNAVSSLANMFQNSELTVNLTNNGPRLVIFNNTISNNTNNAMTLFNANLNQNNNNYRETNKFFGPKPFHHSKQQQQQQNRQQIQPTDLNNLSTNTGYKHNATVSANAGQRYSNRFKYVKSTSISHSATKNSAPYNTTQYIMFDYSRRRPHDQERPTEQNSFTDEWNMQMALAATNSDQVKELNSSSTTNATSSSHSSANPISINNDSIIKVNYNDFSLDNHISADSSRQRLMSQFSLSEQNLDTMDQDEMTGEGESMMQETQSHERMPQLSSSL